MSDVAVTWVQGEQFVASGRGGHSVVLDAPGGRATWHGFKPSELLLAALGGCTGVDVIDILHKKRQQVRSLRITVHGEQAATPPYAFERINVQYEVMGKNLSEGAVARAIALSEEKYCSVAATIRGVTALTTSFSIVEDDAAAEAPSEKAYAAV